MIKHIWFDMAGTLYFENSAFAAAHDSLRFTKYAEITHKPNNETTAKEFIQLYSQFGSNSAVFSSLGMPSDYWQLAFESMDLTSLLSPDDEVLETLNQLRKIVPISLFSNFKPSKIEETLGLLKIPRTYFTNILSGDDVTERKPNLEGFHKIIKLSDLPPDTILYVGDRINVDIKPAHEVGMKTLLLWQESPEADFAALSFPDILVIIGAELPNTES